MVIRQAHPGPGYEAYTSFEQKFRDAERYVQDEKLPWTVVVDDLEGTVHHRWGPMSDPLFLIGADGRLSYYEKWTSAVALHHAIERLLAQGGSGVVGGGIRRRMQLGPPMTDGWRAIVRGLPQSAKELSRAAPGSWLGLQLGHLLLPVVGPFTLRSKPLPTAARVGLGVAVLGALVGIVAAARRGR